MKQNNEMEKDKVDNLEKEKLNKKELDAYLQYVEEHTPDLWDRISEGFDREIESEIFQESDDANNISASDNMVHFDFHKEANQNSLERKIKNKVIKKTVLAVAAAILIVVIAVPILKNTESRKRSNDMFDKNSDVDMESESKDYIKDEFNNADGAQSDSSNDFVADVETENNKETMEENTEMGHDNEAEDTNQGLADGEMPEDTELIVSDGEMPENTELIVPDEDFFDDTAQGVGENLTIDGTEQCLEDVKGHENLPEATSEEIDAADDISTDDADNTISVDKKLSLFRTDIASIDVSSDTDKKILKEKDIDAFVEQFNSLSLCGLEDRPDEMEYELTFTVKYFDGTISEIMFFTPDKIYLKGQWYQGDARQLKQMIEFFALRR